MKIADAWRIHRLLTVKNTTREQWPEVMVKTSINKNSPPDFLPEYMISFISRQYLGRSRKSQIPARLLVTQRAGGGNGMRDDYAHLGFSQHMNTRLKRTFTKISLYNDRMDINQSHSSLKQTIDNDFGLLSTFLLKWLLNCHR